MPPAEQSLLRSDGELAWRAMPVARGNHGSLQVPIRDGPALVLIQLYARCDGQRPTCSACQSLEFECHYEPSESSTNVIVRKEYVSDLTNRLAKVERLLQRHDDLLNGYFSACANLGIAPSAPGSVSHPFFTFGNRADDNLDLHASALEEPGTEESRTDGLAIIFVEENTSMYFGESSNIQFTRLLLRAIAVVRKSPPSVQAVVENEYTLVEKSLATFSQESPSPVENFTTGSHASLKILPSTEDMDSMLDIFFRSTGLLFPFIHQATMRETYNKCVASGFTRVRRTWLGTLNMIFAMASISGQTHATSAKESLESSTLFYERATGLCGEVSKHVISLEVVHYLLLVVLYCQGTQRSAQAWNLHGLLVRSAMALGLHADRIHKPPNGCRQESGRRTWLTIYCLDKVLSMTFGRPAAIPEEYMVPRLPAPWPCPITSTGSDDSDDLPREFLGVSVGLYEIMGNSLVKQYGANVGRSEAELDEMSIFQATGELRRRLQKWVTDLPPHLQLCLPRACEVTEKSQANNLRVILTLKYHNVNMLIHRPLLSIALQNMFAGDDPVTPQTAYQFQLAMAEAQEGVTAAETTINIVHSILVVDQTGSNNLGVWFFTLYYGMSIM